MRINVGTDNQAKIEAVKEIIKDYPMFAGAEVQGVEVSSGVSKQPMSLEEIINGAKNRARNSFDNCVYSVGIESGLMPAVQTKTGYVNMCACVIYDGEHYHPGFSPAFEYPKMIIKKVIEENLSVEEAAFDCGLTKDKKVGSSEGMISIFTKGRMNRKKYTQQAIQMALIHLDNPELY